jgi:hypothetical protein
MHEEKLTKILYALEIDAEPSTEQQALMRRRGGMSHLSKDELAEKWKARMKKTKYRKRAEAIYKQAKELAYYHTYVGHSTEAIIELSARIIDWARQRGLAPAVAPLPLARVPAADALLVCNSVIGLRAVTAIASHSLVPGDTARELAAGLFADWRPESW